jgi:hypothetical protein
MGTTVTTTRGRNFSGTVGLKAGYGPDGAVADPSILFKTWEQWVRSRHDAGRPYLAITIGPVEDIAYAFEEASGLVIRTEPIVTVKGEIASYHEHLSDDQIEETLQSLFGALGAATMQTTVRVLYHGDERRISLRLRLPDTLHPLDNG